MNVPLSLSIINLELPSGTKWASCNLGAEKPEEYGDHYAWGESTVKKVYDWNTYSLCGEKFGNIHCNIGDSRCNKEICIRGTKNDVAYLKWGEKWSLPTLFQMEELIAFCDFEWICLKGVYGGMFTSKRNGNFIFFPAAGGYYGINNSECGKYGYYWSCMQDSKDSNYAYCLNFDSRGSYCASFCCSSCYGYSVRAVAICDD